MSLTKKSQKYHNKTAYEVRFNQKKIEINARAPLDRLCSRCMEQLKWKIQYGKYKPKTSLSRCNKCQDKTIDKAYRTVCDKCCDKDKLCSKCGQSKGIVDAPKQEAQLDRNGVDRDKLQKMQDYMEDLRERSKRTIMRKLMKGEVEFQDGYFVTVPDGKPIKNLKFKADLDEMDDNWEDNEDDDDFDDDDDEDFDDEDEDDKEERKEVSKKGKDGKNKDEEVKESKTEEGTKKVTFKEPAKEKNDTGKGNNKKKAQKKKEESDDDDDSDDDFDDEDDF